MISVSERPHAAFWSDVTVPEEHRGGAQYLNGDGDLMSLARAIRLPPRNVEVPKRRCSCCGAPWSDEHQKLDSECFYCGSMKPAGL